MHEYGIWEPAAVKSQTLKTAIESACLLLRVDEIVSGLNKREKGVNVRQELDQNSAMEQAGVCI